MFQVRVPILSEPCQKFSALNDSSSEGSSSSDEDLDFLFLEAAFPEPRLLGPCLNMEDISEINCEQMFR